MKTPCYDFTQNRTEVQKTDILKFVIPLFLFISSSLEFLGYLLVLIKSGSYIIQK